MIFHLGDKLSYMNNNTCINLYESLESRLASFILKSENNGIFSYNLTECAELLCTSYRHLLRIINLFCNTNKLSKNGKSYKIIDRGYLDILPHIYKQLQQLYIQIHYHYLHQLNYNIYQIFLLFHHLE